MRPKQTDFQLKILVTDGDAKKLMLGESIEMVSEIAENVPVKIVLERKRKIVLDKTHLQLQPAVK
jgi:hypothetical protein